RAAQTSRLSAGTPTLRTWLAPSSAFTYVLVGRAERTAASRSGDKLPRLLPPGESPPFLLFGQGGRSRETPAGALRYWPSGRGSKPLVPTISGINIRRLPQSLGHSSPIWYGAGASFDRQTRTARGCLTGCGGGDISPMSSSSAKTASAPDSFFTATLAEADPEIANAIKGELGRQRHE